MQNTMKLTRSLVYSKEIPHVIDGLTPLKRQILAKTQQMTAESNCAYRRTRTVITEFDGPHVFSEMLPRSPFGASRRIYNAIMNMVQDWKAITLLDGHGNFGTIGRAYTCYADPTYNEIRLSDYAKAVFDTDNVQLDGRGDTAFTALAPNVLISGTEGTHANIPPHNLGEVIDAAVAMIRTPDMDEDRLPDFIKGPDFNNCGIIINKSELAQLYRTGVGNIRMRGRVDIERDDENRPHLIIKEFPFTLISMMKSVGVDQEWNRKLEEFILDEFLYFYDTMGINDESRWDSIRIDVALKKRSNAEKHRNALYFFSHMEGSYEYRAILTSDSGTKLWSLREILAEWLTFYRRITAEQNGGTPLTDDQLCERLINVKEKFASPRKTEIIDA